MKTLDLSYVEHRDAHFMPKESWKIIVMTVMKNPDFRNIEDVKIQFVLTLFLEISPNYVTLVWWHPNRYDYSC